jgi:hypothetical protein
VIRTLACSASSKFSSKQSAASCRKCVTLVKKLKDYIQVNQILFVVYERSLNLDCNQNFYLNALGALGPILFLFCFNKV